MNDGARPDELATRRTFTMSKRAKRANDGPATDLASEGAEDLLKLVYRDVDEAMALGREILARPPAERLELVQEVRFQDVNLCQVLKSQSKRAGCKDPVEGVELARLAVDISNRLDEERHGRGLVVSAQVTAWACLGNAYRVASDLERAEEALDEAEMRLRRSSGEPYTEAKIYRFRASLRSSQGRFREAAKLLDPALAIYRQDGESYLEGKTLMQKAMALTYDGKIERAARLLWRGLSLIEPWETSRLFMTSRHNLIGYLNEIGSPDAALETVHRSRLLYLDFGDPSLLARLSWLEGRLNRDLGWVDEAEVALKDALNYFDRHMGWFDAAMVLLDLATVYEHHGDGAELQRLAEMVPMFAAWADLPEMLAPLALF